MEAVALVGTSFLTIFPLNPSPVATLLTMAAVGLLLYCAWLMLRPARDS